MADTENTRYRHGLEEAFPGSVPFSFGETDPTAARHHLGPRSATRHRLQQRNRRSPQRKDARPIWPGSKGVGGN